MVDVLPGETERWQAVESISREHLSRAGFKEIRTPLLEVTDLFSRSIGEATDVVSKEMYSFIDRGDRSCTLRPEGTAAVVRAVLEHGLLNKGFQRLWYCGPMFRYERPQTGRQRQFHQLGVECFGMNSPTSDAEVISIAWDLLSCLRIEGLVLEINSLGASLDRKKYRDELVDWLKVHFEKLDLDSKQRLDTNPLRILDSKSKQTQDLLQEAPQLKDFLCEESTQRFLALQEILKHLKIPFKVNPCLVRGLDYYSHTAFEITSHHLGSQATVCGGGRYDGLVGELGGSPTSGFGWAIGLERLLMLLGDSIHRNWIPDVYVVNRGIKAEISALVLARKLRAFDLRVQLDSSGASFSKQFKRADRSSATWALVLGDDEVTNGEVRLKRLHSNKMSSTVKEHIFSSSDLEGLMSFLLDEKVTR